MLAAFALAWQDSGARLHGPAGGRRSTVARGAAVLATAAGGCCMLQLTGWLAADYRTTRSCKLLLMVLLVVLMTAGC